MDEGVNLLSNFSSRPVFTEFHLKPTVKGRCRIYSKGRAPLTKIATIFKYDKKKSVENSLSKVNKRTRELIQSDPHQAHSIKGKDRQTQ